MHWLNTNNHLSGRPVKSTARNAAASVGLRRRCCRRCALCALESWRETIEGCCDRERYCQAINDAYRNYTALGPGLLESVLSTVLACRQAPHCSSTSISR